jgi:L-rhamnose-H+ transport protein
MSSMILMGVFLAILSGAMNGSFTLPMRFLGEWEWENVWSLFIVISCLLMPAAIVTVVAPASWSVLAEAPAGAIWIAILTGFSWGFGALLFGQSVSAIGISLANTLVLAISSALGSLVPILLLAPEKLLLPTGERIVTAVAVELAWIALCGWAGHMRESATGVGAERGGMVGHARPMGVALAMAAGSGVLSAVFNIGFSLAQPIADYGHAAGLSQLSSTNLIWWIMLGAGAFANLGFCFFMLRRNRSWKKFAQPRSLRLYTLSALMALLWGGSIFIYGAAAPRLGELGTSIGWPLSLAVGLLLANVIGMALGEWKHAPRRALSSMFSGIALLMAAIVLLGWAGGGGS